VAAPFNIGGRDDYRREPALLSRASMNEAMALGATAVGISVEVKIMAMIEMLVEGIGLDPENRPLVLLRDEDRKTFVPIWIGPAEAMSIQSELEKKPQARPMTHDLMSNIFRELGIRLVKVTVNDFTEQVYYASLHLQIDGNDATLREIDARPSDAIALALRAQCQILVDAEVAERAGFQFEEAENGEGVFSVPEGGEADSPPDEIEKFSRLLEGVDLGETEKN